MSLCKSDVLSDLVYALNYLEGQHRFDSPLTDAVDLDVKPNERLLLELRVIGEHSYSYPQAVGRAEVTVSHAAVEKGLKALLIEGGVPVDRVIDRRHHLHKLLSDARKHIPAVFDELERCFYSTTDYLERVTRLPRREKFTDYFRDHGRGEVYRVIRYESLEGRDPSDPWGMIGQIYREIIRALISLLLGRPPKDINSRIEEGAREAVLASGELATWDAIGWVEQGPVRPRLEDLPSLHNKVLYAAVRRMERYSKSSAVRMWAERLRHDYTNETKRERVERWSAWKDRDWHNITEAANLAACDEQSS